jgi:predicted regulator of Ras-like GTPase activity (Roadblock/LC7/MglB family)
VKPKSYRRKASRQREELKILVTPNPRASQVVAQMLVELPGLLAVAVVDVASGTSLAAHSNSSIDPNTAATFHAEVIKLKQKAMAALQLDKEQLDDILITLSSQGHLIKLASAGSKFIYLVVDTQTTSLAMARLVLRVQAEQLN